jgi:hypothetical protein
MVDLRAMMQPCLRINLMAIAAAATAFSLCVAESPAYA